MNNTPSPELTSLMSTCLLSRWKSKDYGAKFGQAEVTFHVRKKTVLLHFQKHAQINVHPDLNEEMERTVMKEIAEVHEEHAPLMDPEFETFMTVGLPGSWINMGQIKRLHLPEGWMMTSKQIAKWPQSYKFNFAPHRNSPIVITFCCENMDEPNTSLNGILFQPPHELEDTEITELTDLLEDFPDRNRDWMKGSELIDAQTEEFGGNVVLMVTSIYRIGPEIPRVLECRVFITDGPYIQELRLCAREDIGREFLPQFQQILERIEWSDRR